MSLESCGVSQGSRPGFLTGYPCDCCPRRHIVCRVESRLGQVIQGHGPLQVGPRALACRSMLVLRQTVSDLIVITLLCYEDVHLQMDGSWRVECAHRDADPVSRRRIKEQGRSAHRAEP